MSIRVNVAGGTNAGRKTAPRAPAPAWVHVCAAAPLDGGRELPGRCVNCPDCYARRPKP